MDNNKVKPLGKKEFENDKKLEQKLIDVQEQLGCLRGILSDYIYMDSPSRSHVGHTIERFMLIFIHYTFMRAGVVYYNW